MSKPLRIEYPGAWYRENGPAFFKSRRHVSAINWKSWTVLKYQCVRWTYWVRFCM